MRSTIASRTASTPWPVFAETRSTRSGSSPTSSASSRAAPSGSACGRSILFTRGSSSRSFSIARYAFATVCASTPWAASTTSTAPSHAWSERETSYVKSTWPGVSIRFSSWPFHCDADRLGLDRDPALALELHRVEHLRAHLATGHRVRDLENAVGERRLAVVDVRDDREVADSVQVHGDQPRRKRPSNDSNGVQLANSQQTAGNQVGGEAGDQRGCRGRRVCPRANGRAPRRASARPGRRRSRAPPRRS